MYHHQYSGSPKSYSRGPCDLARRRPLYINGPFSPKTSIYSRTPPCSSHAPLSLFQSYFKPSAPLEGASCGPSALPLSTLNLHQGDASPNDSLRDAQLLTPPSPIHNLTPQGSFRMHHGVARESSVRVRRQRILSGHHSFNCPRTFSPHASFRRRQSSNGLGSKGAPPYLGRRNTISSSGGGGHCPPTPLSLRDIYQLSRQGSLKSRHSLFQQPSLVSLSLGNRQTSIAENADENDTEAKKSPSIEEPENVAQKQTVSCLLMILRLSDILSLIAWLLSQACSLIRASCDIVSLSNCIEKQSWLSMN